MQALTDRFHSSPLAGDASARTAGPNTLPQSAERVAIAAEPVPTHRSTAASVTTLPTLASAPHLPANQHASLTPMSRTGDAHIIEFTHFDAVRDSTYSSFCAMYDVIDSIKHDLPILTRAAERDPFRSVHLQDFKAYRDAQRSDPNFPELKRQGEAAYAKIKSVRPDSLLEQHLPAEWQQKLSPVLGCFRDPVSGLAADLRQVSEKGGTKAYVLCFPGTFTGAAHIAQLGVDIKQFFGIGGVPPAYAQAVELTAALRQSLPQDIPLKLAGHSLGGGIANYVGLKLDLPSSCFNPAALGEACQKDLKDSVPDLADRVDKQTIIRIDFDPVSSPIVQEVIIRAHPDVTREKILIPQCIGKIHIAPRDSLRVENRPISKIHSLPALEDLYFYKAH